MLSATKNNLILLFKQLKHFKQFLLNWITNISLLTLQPFIANIGRKERWFISQQLSTFTFTLHAGLHYLACLVLTEARCVGPEISWPFLLPPPSSIYQDNWHPSSPGFSRRCLKINCGIFQSHNSRYKCCNSLKLSTSRRSRSCRVWTRIMLYFV